MAAMAARTRTAWPEPVKLRSNGIELSVTEAGDGPVLLLIHGWPHTARLWAPLVPLLSGHYRLVMPDLRGIGGSTKAADGYDIDTLADDMVGVLDALEIDAAAAVAGIDAGVPVAWMLAMRHPRRVRKLALMEGLLGALPGAEGSFSRGAPWWFGFHGIPDFAERLLAGREADYLDYFYRSGTAGGKGISPEARTAFIDAYGQPDAMRCGFEYYRAMPENGRRIAELATSRRLAQPTLAVAGGVVGIALYNQLAPICDDLRGASIADCGHIIPQEQPRALAEMIAEFAAPPATAVRP